MQLDKFAIDKLQKKIAAADSKIKELRAGLLQHVTVTTDSKFALVIASKHRDEAKRTVHRFVVSSIDCIASHHVGYTSLISLLYL